MRMLLRTLGRILGLGLLVACPPHPSKPGAVCGGAAHKPCAATEYCDYADDRCGAGDQTGTCKPRPEFCPKLAGPPSCACDGRTYRNACIAIARGSGLDAGGSCDVAAGRFVCGYLQCSLDAHYCLREIHASGADTYRCVQLPPCDKPPPGCGDLAHERCGDACAGDAKQGLTLTCAGP